MTCSSLFSWKQGYILLIPIALLVGWLIFNVFSKFVNMPEGFQADTSTTTADTTTTTTTIGTTTLPVTTTTGIADTTTTTTLKPPPMEGEPGLDKQVTEKPLADSNPVNKPNETTTTLPVTTTTTLPASTTIPETTTTTTTTTTLPETTTTTTQPAVTINYVNLADLANKKESKSASMYKSV